MMHVFKNTPSWNRILWNVKAFIEIRPISFPHGEPTEEDVGNLRVLPTGECIVDKKLHVPSEELDLEKKRKQLKQFTTSYLLSQSTRQWFQTKEILEDNLWSDPNTSRLD